MNEFKQGKFGGSLKVDNKNFETVLIRQEYLPVWEKPRYEFKPKLTLYLVPIEKNFYWRTGIDLFPDIKFVAPAGSYKPTTKHRDIGVARKVLAENVLEIDVKSILFDALKRVNTIIKN